MAITAQLVFQGVNHLRYLLTQDGAAGTTLSITTTGAATPDIRTDSLGGPLKALARAQTDGFGGTALFAAGSIGLTGSRALWASEWGAAGVTGPGPMPGPMQKTVVCEITPRTGDIVQPWLADPNVDGGSNPIIFITGPAGASAAYLDVEIPNQIGA